jgi:hypothetical protein
MIPAYSAEAATALDLFFGEHVDLLLFFEDQDCEALYNVVAKKILPNRELRAICLSGKDSVLAHSKIKTDYRAKRLYILDLDFDDFLNKLVDRENLVYLRRYSIENYLIERDAIIEVVQEEHPKADRSKIEAQINLENFLASASEPLMKLVKAFVAVQKYDLAVPNAALPIESFCDVANGRYPCEAKVAKYLGQVAEALVSREISSDVDSASVLVDEACPATAVLERAPGKMLLALIYRHLSNTAEIKSIRQPSLMYRLAKNCSFEELAFIREKADALI